MEGCPKAPLIKICGLKAPEEAALASSLGASFCGFIFHPPSPRSVTPEAAAAMRTPGALRVGVFVRQQAAEIEEIMEKAGLDLAQLHGEHGLETAKALGRERVVKVFWPERRRMGPDGKEERLSDLLEGWKDLAKMLLFDAGQSLGGHGRKLEASFSSPLPYLLAGGLSARDVLSAWPPEDENLVGFDLSSSLESSPGRKDPEAIKSFFRVVSPLGVGKAAGKPRI